VHALQALRTAHSVISRGLLSTSQASKLRGNNSPAICASDVRLQHFTRCHKTSTRHHYHRKLFLALPECSTLHHQRALDAISNRNLYKENSRQDATRPTVTSRPCPKRKNLLRLVLLNQERRVRGTRRPPASHVSLQVNSHGRNLIFPEVSIRTPRGKQDMQRIMHFRCSPTTPHKKT
jgi:hypothetical protein